MHDRDFEVYLQAERSSLWLLLGCFNIIACLITLDVPPVCNRHAYFYAIPQNYLLFGISLWCICVTLEFLSRWLILEFNPRQFIKAGIHSIVNNLWGMPILLFTLAKIQGWITCGILVWVLFLLSTNYLLERQSKIQKDIDFSALIWSPLLSSNRKFFLALLVISLGITLLSIAQSISPHPCEGYVSSTKANMHVVQTLVETYAFDHQGKAPHDLHELEVEAKNKEYWKEFRNPYGSSCRYFAEGNCTMIEYKAYQERHLQKIQLSFSSIINKTLELIGLPMDLPFLPAYVRYWHGLVLYQFIAPNHYRIYGTDKNGDIIQDKGQDFYLMDENP